MRSITYVFGGARGVGRIARARKLFRLVGPLLNGGGYSFVACEDSARWPGAEVEPWVVSYRFGEVPDLGVLTRGERPTVFVDAYPDGPAGVMARLLPLVRARRPAAKVVLVVRDILDEPRRVIARLSQEGYALLARYYSGIVVLGRRAVFDAGGQYRLPLPTYFLGYLPPEPPVEDPPSTRSTCSILMSAGGGDDANWMPCVAGLLRGSGRLTVISGPNADPRTHDELVALESGTPGMRVVRRVDSVSRLLPKVEMAVIAGGYNSMTETIHCGVPAIVIPREQPTLEQLIRANLLRDLAAMEVVRRPPDGAWDAFLESIELAASRLRSERARPVHSADWLFAGPTDAAGLMEWLDGL